VSGSGIRWATCKSAPRSRQITMPAPHCSVFYRPDALSAAQPTVSKHWRQSWQHQNKRKILQLLLMLMLLLFSCCVCQTSTSSRRCCCLDYQVFSVMLARHRYDATTLPARVAAGNSVLNLQWFDIHKVVCWCVTSSRGSDNSSSCSSPIAIDFKRVGPIAESVIH